MSIRHILEYYICRIKPCYKQYTKQRTIVEFLIGTLIRLMLEKKIVTKINLNLNLIIIGQSRQKYSK